jgi:hypothetical protein
MKLLFKKSLLFVLMMLFIWFVIHIRAASPGYCRLNSPCKALKRTNGQSPCNLRKNGIPFSPGAAENRNF